MSKERADILCVEQGLFDSREKAKRAINEGIVKCGHQIVNKPGLKLSTDCVLYIEGEKLPYVSRGGLKLEKAINEFDIQIENVIMLDIGSSTGGFTDCALQNGAKKVYALDVGTDQLADKLRNDNRVHSMEKTNFRYASLDMFQFGIPDFASIDVSFISLKHIFEPLSRILKKDCYFVALIKPQFEAGKEDIGKKGVVSDSKVHLRVIQNVIEFAHENKMSIKGLTYSPVASDIGNIEFLGFFQNSENSDVVLDLEKIVKDAHSHFKG